MASQEEVQRSVKMVPINLHTPSEFTELLRQRHICGWGNTDEIIRGWREKQDEGVKSFFWIVIPEPKNSNTSDQGVAPKDLYVGHISLDSLPQPLDPELASLDKSILTIQSFFILPEYRSWGLGRVAMDIMEKMATQEPYGSPNCKFVTVNALSKRYLEDDSPEWGGVWTRSNRNRPAFSNEVWYERRGYVKWKEVPIVPVEFFDGGSTMLVFSFMKKAVK